MKNKTLIKDIAQAAGVSSALVSYVLNGKAKKARVSATTAKRIEKIAEELNYRPNQIAKTLKSGRSLSIGLIVADISNPFFGKLARCIENESQKRGYTVLFGSADEDAEKSKQLVEALVGRQMDGFIIVPAQGSEEQLEYLKKLSIPFVLIDRYFKTIPSNYVVIDNFQATYKATEYLIKKGHEKIGYVRYKNKQQHTEDRYNGYLKALKDYNKKIGENQVCKIGFKDECSFKQAFKKLLTHTKRLDAVVFSTNTLSLLGLKTIKDLNIKVPEELDLFCFDESDAYDLFYTSINYVRQPLEEMAHEAVDKLMKQISKNETELNGSTLNVQFVIDY